MNNKLFLSLTALTLLLFIATACDVTSSDDDHEDHQDPWGIALFMDGAEIARQFSGTITYTDGDHLELHVGEESNLIRVRFLDEDGDTFEPQDDDLFLAWDIDHEDHLEVEQHESDGKWAFHLVGLSEGEADVIFHLMHGHGESAHPDFSSQPFEVHIESEVNGMKIEDENGQDVVSVDSNRNVTGQITLQEGATTAEWAIRFLDDHGDPVEPGDQYEFEWDIEDPSVATIQQVDGSEWAFTVTGVSAGETDVHFFLVTEEGEHSHKVTMANDEHEEHEGEIILYESPHIDIIVE
ncbi:MAG: Ig-like domain-containing protein [Balneolaceae bacterium]